ncbi:hypothetical protein RJJ65_13830 [Rhizobium hidalgonense]|uniref:Uncharacterized protein n=2 Tax=Rhizobium hidalgonense TaxID=1538159 RepID=A0AAJ2LM55_9HYPH|nr:hypothetical protein [Rhizobium hidalgonense]MDR9773731.1 hypothetical protein [Rhizobium hidalgonense]MDR9810965.1 hypothetical protein [Rhizobium hidalgonense]MDR9819248.1 hypothetical protein [Rhizobium hidalgonense]
MDMGAGNPEKMAILALLELHLPEHLPLAQRLLDVDENFHSMCQDLAAAIEALTKVDLLPSSIREVRRQEYGSLVEGLVEEIGDAIRRSKVVALRRSTDPMP